MTGPRQPTREPLRPRGGLLLTLMANPSVSRRRSLDSYEKGSWMQGRGLAFFSLDGSQVYGWWLVIPLIHLAS